MIVAMISLGAALAFTGQGAPAEPKKTQRERMECRVVVDTATRIGRRRICATKMIWDQIREENLESTAHRKVDAERSAPFSMPPR